MIVVLLIGAIKGFTRGFIVEIFSFVAFFVGLFLAIELSIPVTDKYFGESEYFQSISIVVFVVLFLVTVISINLLAKILKKAFQLALLGTLDRIFGSAISLVKWAFIVSVFFWVFDSLGIHVPEKLEKSSLIFPYVADFGPKTFEWIGNEVPFIEDMIDGLREIGGKGKSIYT